MKPASFAYLRPADVAEACPALHAAEGAAKLMAGGQSLGPMLNLRLVQPATIIDIAGIPVLRRADQDGARIEIGATVTHAAIEDGRAPTDGIPLLRRVAGGIAYRAVRNRGTIGGSLSHADPAADWVNLLSALDASYRLAGASAYRQVKATDFMAAAFETALQPGEILESVTIPRLSPKARFGHVKIARKAGKFAMAVSVVVVDEPNGICRALIGATAGPPILVDQAQGLLGGGRLDEATAIALLAAHGVGEGPQRVLHLTALRRAVEDAFPS